MLNGTIATVGIAFAALVGTPASAIIQGTVYQNNPTSTDASIIPSSSLPRADFTTSTIDFNTGSSVGTTTANFLNNPVFTNAQNGFDPSANANNLFLLLTGQAFLLSGSNSFVVGHDDGVVITFPGLNGGLPVVNEPGPTALSLTPFNVVNPGAAGLYSFTLQYTECCAGPANLVFTINGDPPNAAVPEPASWALLVGGFGLVGLSVRRRRRTSVALS